ncbi:hypothetical protein [uncultured Methylobacterium sp.]|uniref:hypothetical protein n=1 Tax=uncultured Methylobacterium sp. TaxID=157278 RepID=UPI002589F363|nr:hypothetical protein [uncultured Methylobacterium sp.]
MPGTNRGGKAPRDRIERIDRGSGRDPVDIRIVVSTAPGGRGRARLPWPVRLALRLAVPALVLVVVFVLPHYLDCQRPAGTGFVVQGVGDAACLRRSVSGQIDETQKRFEDIARAVGAR